MKNQVYNPYLPLTEYVPDGEPHVFGNRVYVYGSHDQARSDRFCVQDYTVYSAPVDDLSQWTHHGVSYRKDQDLRASNDKLPDYYAPDCVKGNDGRYYLYYSAMGPNVKQFGPMSVAVSNQPEGPYSYLGDIQYPDGKPMTEFLTNDPAVINDNGRIWLYYGWGLGRDFRSKLFAPLLNFVQSKLFQRPVSEIKSTKPSIMSCAVVELEDDMITVKSAPKAVLDSKTTAEKNSALYNHAFYEAASIRKFGDLYYLVYSSGENNELAYATSKYPDHDFTYRGVIISNSDLGFNGNTKPKAPAGTIHGGIESINGKYYVFYHRSTNNTDFSRQTCAEEISISKDGTIKQVEVTSCGLNGGPLVGRGKYPAAICCNLFGKKTYKLGNQTGYKYPRVYEEKGQVYVHDICDGTTVGYKYFNFEGDTEISLTLRGHAKGKLTIMLGQDEPMMGQLEVHTSKDWHVISTILKLPQATSALYFCYHGEGKLDLLEICFSKVS